MKIEHTKISYMDIKTYKREQNKAHIHTQNTCNMMELENTRCHKKEKEGRMTRKEIQDARD